MAHALVIDDNAKNTSVLTGLLAREGVTVTSVLHPRELPAAIKTLKAVDVVFLDLEMPGQNGYEVLAVLRADPKFASVPIVAYTVHVSEIGVAHQQGFNSFIAKPLDSDRFPEQLQRILSGQPVWDSV